MRRYPTFFRTLLLCAIFLVVFLALYSVFGLIEAPGFSAKTRLELGRWGLVLSYLAAIVAMTGLFHDNDVVAEQRRLEASKEGLHAQLTLIRAIQEDLAVKLSARATEIANEVVVAQDRLDAISRYPNEMKKIYWFSGLLLVVGTTLQLVSLSQ